MHLILNAPGCLPSILIGRNWNPCCPRIAVFSSTLFFRNWTPALGPLHFYLLLLLKNWNLFEQPCSYFFLALYNIFFLYSTSFCFSSLERFFSVHGHTLAFCFFSSSVRFWYLLWAYCRFFEGTNNLTFLIFHTCSKANKH